MPVRFLFVPDPEVLVPRLKGRTLASNTGFPQIICGGPQAGFEDRAPAGGVRFDNAERFENTGDNFSGLTDAEIYSSMVTWSPDSSGTGARQTIWIIRVGTGNNDRVEIFQDTDDIIKADLLSSSGGGTVTVSTGTAVAFGNWYQIFLVRNSGTVTLYVNGVQEDQVTSSLPTQTDPGRRYAIGSNAAAGQMCRGRIGQQATWDAALSVDDVRTLFNHGDWETLDLMLDWESYNNSADLIRWYATCDEPSLPSNLLKDRVSPATSTRRLTASNIKQGLVNAEAWWSPGGGGAYVKFTPATSERFHNAGPLDPGFVAAVTVEAWVRLAALDAGNEKVIFNVDDSSGNDAVLLRKNASDLWEFDSYDTVGNSANAVSAAADVRTGEWIHLVGSASGTSNKLYMNGKLVQTDATATAMASDATRRISIGATNGNIDFWDGDIRSVRVWNRALSDAEVEAIFFEGYGHLDASRNMLNYSSGGLIHNWLLGQPARTGESGNDTITDFVDTGGIDLGAGATAITVADDVIVLGDGPKGVAYDFDGITDRIGDDTTRDLGFGPEWTIGIWIYARDNTTTGIQTIMEIDNNADNINRILFQMDPTGGVPGRFRMQAWDSGGTLQQNRRVNTRADIFGGMSGAPIPQDKWTFLAIRMRDDAFGFLESMINGATTISEAADNNGDITPMTNTDRRIRFGMNFAGGEIFDGLIGPIYIWSGGWNTLTDAEMVEVARTRAFDPVRAQGDYASGGIIQHWWTPGNDPTGAIPDRGVASVKIDLSDNVGASVTHIRNARVITPDVPWQA